MHTTVKYSSIMYIADIIRNMRWPISDLKKLSTKRKKKPT